MNIQKRLRFSYILMLLIPVLLLVISGGIIRHIYTDKNENKTTFTKEFLILLYGEMAHNPESLLDRNFLRELDEKSGYPGKTNIYVEKNGHLKNFLENSHGGKHRGDDDRNDAVSSWEFYFSDNTTGLMTIAVYDTKLMKGMFITGGLTLLLAVCILIITNGLLSWFVAKSIIYPIKILERSALNIKNEDLDSPVVYKGDDEFKDVCFAFEEMRIRLKDSLHEQLKYEENRKELLSNISHDLKTPITAIKGYIEGIRDGIADSPEKINKYMDTVYSKTVLMNDLIDRLFLFSKLDLNRIQFNFQNIDIVAFLQDSCEELRFDYPDMNIILSEYDSPQYVSADSIQLHRVITNLVDNAWKYSGREHTDVTVGLIEKENSIEVSIHNNGREISAESLPRIFERFYRSDPARSSQSEGSGLGLSISSQIIKAHGGKIKAVSSREQGTTIRFTLRKAK